MNYYIQAEWDMVPRWDYSSTKWTMISTMQTTANHL